MARVDGDGDEEMEGRNKWLVLPGYHASAGISPGGDSITNKSVTAPHSDTQLWLCDVQDTIIA
jgi:hypothetical protein